MAKKQTILTDEYHEVAQLLKQKRLAKKLTRQKVAQSLRLPVETIAQLESLKSRTLPSSNILGLYKRYARLLGVEEEVIDQAVLEVEKKQHKNSFRTKPAVTKAKRNYIVSRAAVLITVLCILIVLLGYGLWQLIILIDAPSLTLRSPSDNSVVLNSDLEVAGTVASDATILINGEPAAVGEDGSFSVMVYLQPGYNQITISAVNNFSRQYTEQRTVFFETNENQPRTVD